jgi:hypothetical protein
MPKSTYIVDYGVYFNKRFETHQIKVKNCLSELQAKIKLEGYCKKKYPNFESLVVYKCLNDWLGIMDIFTDFRK